jgi:hypothetical protein
MRGREQEQEERESEKRERRKKREGSRAEEERCKASDKDFPASLAGVRGRLGLSSFLCLSLRMNRAANAS